MLSFTVGNDFSIEMLHSMTPEIQHAKSAKDLDIKDIPSLKMIIHNSSNDYDGMLRYEDILATSITKNEIETLGQMTNSTKCDDPVNLQFTSGTTGHPKGAMLSHKNILNNGYFIGERMKLTSADSVCIPVPLFHCFGLVLGNLAAITHGAKIVYPSAGFDAKAVLQTVHQERCTALHGVPVCLGKSGINVNRLCSLQN